MPAELTHTEVAFSENGGGDGDDGGDGGSDEEDNSEASSYLYRVISSPVFTHRPNVVALFCIAMIIMTCLSEWIIGGVCGKHKPGSLKEWCPVWPRWQLSKNFSFSLMVLGVASNSSVIKGGGSVQVLLIGGFIWMGMSAMEYISISSASASLAASAGKYVPLSQCPSR
jgi:hypothetical protein